MALVLLLLFLAVPLVELYVIVQVADVAGVWSTIGLLLLISLAGSWLVRAEGIGVLRRVRQTLARGELPTDDLLNGIMILFAGALLLTPGFVTDAVGLLLLLPPSRALLRTALLRRYSRRLNTSFGFGPTGAAGPTDAGPRPSGGWGVHVGEATIITEARERGEERSDRSSDDGPRAGPVRPTELP